MKIAFDWQQEYMDGRYVNVRRTKTDRLVAKVYLQQDEIFGNSYVARLYDYDEETTSRYVNMGIPTNYQFAETISQAKRWADKNLKHLGYKLLPNKYKILL